MLDWTNSSPQENTQRNTQFLQIVPIWIKNSFISFRVFYPFVILSTNTPSQDIWTVDIVTYKGKLSSLQSVEKMILYVPDSDKYDNDNSNILRILKNG